MYISLYDRYLNHLTNVRNIKFKKFERLFEFDSFKASGQLNRDTTGALYYVVNSDTGVPIFSGLVGNVNLEIDKDITTFYGLDYRIAFNTEILLDFSQNETQDFTLKGIFEKVSGLVNYIEIFGEDIEVEVIIPEDEADTTVIANYTGQFFITNAHNFLNTYLEYFNYYIKSELDLVNNKIIFTFVKNTKQLSIKLKDFINNQYTSDVVFNRAIATLSYNNILEVASWLDSNEEDWNGQPEANKIEITISTLDALPDASNYPGNYYVKAYVSEEELYYYYKSKAAVYSPRPILPEIEYNLTNDNEIVVGVISDETKRIYPTKTVIFQDNYLESAKFNSINELLKSKYSEVVEITNDILYNPVDFEELELFTNIDIYTDNGFYKRLPIAEKEINFETSSRIGIIRLGFKKTLFTQIYQGGK
jgi:hypothetical protein